MNKKEREYVQGKIENEGFDYCFVDFSDFKQIKDTEFHKLREAYCAAHKALSDYLEGA